MSAARLSVCIRPAADADIEAVRQVYAEHVLAGFGTFEEEPPDAREIIARRAASLRLQLPYLVATQADQVVGFAYAAPFRLRSAYRYTVEDSVYVAADAMGRGIGKSLLGEVIAVCERLGLRQIMAVIGDSRNEASIALHRSLGFELAGTCRAVGYKKGRWLDTVWMQRSLGAGDGATPDSPGLALGRE